MQHLRVTHVAMPTPAQELKHVALLTFAKDYRIKTCGAIQITGRGICGTLGPHGISRDGQYTCAGHARSSSVHTEDQKLCMCISGREEMLSPCGSRAQCWRGSDGERSAVQETTQCGDYTVRYDQSLYTTFDAHCNSYRIRIHAQSRSGSRWR